MLETTWIKIPTVTPVSDKNWREAGQIVEFALRTYYEEPWRHYHTWDHVKAFQSALDEMQDVSPMVRVAGYFHDIVWLPGYSENEERSAEIAKYWLTELDVENWFIKDVVRLILATKHSGEPPVDLMEAQIRDADLASLAFPEDEYLSIQTKIWKEFPNVSETDFLAARKKLFARMGKFKLFWTPEFQAKEGIAWENLARTLTLV